MKRPASRPLLPLLSFLLPAVLWAGSLRAQDPAPSSPDEGVSRAGTVDVSIAWMFHPYMKDFVPEDMNFSAVFPEDMPEADRRAMLQSRFDEQDKLRKGVEDLRTRAGAVEREVGEAKSKAYQDFNRAQGELMVSFRKKIKVATDPNPVAKEQTAQMAALEKDYWKKVEELHGKLQKAKEDLKAAQDQAIGLTMLTRKDLDERTQVITRDIMEGIDYARKRKNLLVVFNSAFLFPRPSDIPPKPDPTERFLGQVMPYTNPFREFMLFKPGTGPAPTDRILREMDPEERQLDYWMELRERVYPFYANSYFNQFVIHGGEDITDLVLGYVLAKYRVPNDKSLKIRKYVAKLSPSGWFKSSSARGGR